MCKSNLSVCFRKKLQSSTYFRMELRAQKNATCGDVRSKRRIYLYFDQPCFVLPYVDDKATESSLFSPINNDNEEGIISQEKRKKSASKCLTKEREQNFL